MRRRLRLKITKSCLSEMNDARSLGWNDTRNLRREVNMTLRISGPTVKQFPQILNLKHRRYFLCDLQRHMNIDRPYIVLDFSNVSRMDRPGVNLLLCCLEEALKRNGDIKLAAIPEGARSVLRHTEVDHLFQIFDTIAEAASSFRQLPPGAVNHVDESGSTCRTSGHAA